MPSEVSIEVASSKAAWILICLAFLLRSPKPPYSRQESHFQDIVITEMKDVVDFAHQDWHKFGTERGPDLSRGQKREVA